MSISAALVKELRERTGAGMMECKKALVETNGDIEAAVEHMRKTGMAKADKKADRVAADGVVAILTSADKRTAVMFEINSETDFVAKGEDFQNFVNGVVATTLAGKPTSIDELNTMTISGGSATVDEARRALISKIGENISLRRFTVVSTTGVIGGYSHGSRIGVIVDM
ncbi:MAG: translation elongation factor Ts, partial [Gammaproteobacteria bacterium]|nr:translation elongation factor Ts [Gammaproteobacteria bacterium]